jgi:hypothetical protein
MSSLKRPHSLAEVASRSASFRDFAYHVADFLHHFNANPSYDSIAAEPASLAGRFPEGHIADCYLAAIAVELTTRLDRPRPAWSQRPERFCHEPWFASPGPHMRALLLLESPPGFRERNLFVTANALSVA